MFRFWSTNVPRDASRKDWSAWFDDQANTTESYNLECSVCFNAHMLKYCSDIASGQSYLMLSFIARDNQVPVVNEVEKLVPDVHPTCFEPSVRYVQHNKLLPSARRVGVLRKGCLLLWRVLYMTAVYPHNSNPRRLFESKIPYQIFHKALVLVSSIVSR